MYKADRKEPFWWGMFSLGGVVAALLVPIHIFVDGLAVPLGLLDPEALGYEHMRQLIAQPWVKVYLFVLVVLPLYHAAHRVRFSLYELGMREFRISMHVLCYGAALAGTGLAAYILFRLF
jgi:fumarate reductase subunit D